MTAICQQHDLTLADRRIGGRDPTRTTVLRSRFRKAARLHINQFRARLREAIVEHDLLGLDGTQSSMAFHPIVVRLTAFNEWLVASSQPFVAGDWVDFFINAAWVSGEKAADGVTPAVQRLEAIAQLKTSAKHEIVGVMAATQQQLTRTADIVITRELSRSMAWRLMLGVLDRVLENRTNALVNMSVVTAHNRARLAVYTSQGHESFGLIPEELPRPIVRDARSRSKFFKVQTAEDDYVCPRCIELAESGPYTSGEIIGLIPLHLNCRCTVVPWRGAYRESEEE